MSSLNKIILMGRCASDADVKATTNGSTMLRFSLAVDRPKGGSDQTQTDFFQIVGWESLAEQAQDICKKGAMVMVEGQIRERSYEDSEGRRKWITEIEAKQLRPVGAAQSDTAPSRDDFAAPSVDTASAELEPIVMEKPVQKVEESEFSFASSPEPAASVEEDVPF